jgi:hypothetical protein
MTDRPIIFSAPMVRALLDGRKTQTRRVLKPQPDTTSDPSGQGQWGSVNRYGYWRPVAEICPVQPDDRLWVKETIRPQLLRHILTGEELPGKWATAYDADGEDVVNSEGFNCVPWWNHGGKLSPIYMPRWASRITLTVTDVRVQRVWEISEADAVAEGFASYPPGRSAQIQFHAIWNSLHGPEAWDANPWVYALTFTVHYNNIDAMMGGAE